LSKHYHYNNNFRSHSVYYAPVDEDFGMVPFEAFLSEKPVLTTTDAGGPLEIVSDGDTGLVVSPDAGELARATGWLREHRTEAAELGRAGRAIAEGVTWGRAVERLLA
jgi:glycosyltransferase involved in cell wall biosynthesis